MAKIVDLTGQRFGRLTVHKMAPREIWKHNESHWYCECQCGNKVVVMASSLNSGNTKSCGCLRRELVSKREKRHGHSIAGIKTSTYICWDNMLARCTNPN